MTPPDTLEDRLAQALRSRADALPIDDRPFIPASSAPPVLDLDDDEDPGGPRRFVAPVVAAAVAAVFLLGAVWAVRSLHAPSARTEVGQAPTTSTPARPLPLGLAPNWLPSDLELQRLSALRVTGPGLENTQLFGTADGRAQLFVQVQVGGASLPAGSPTTVRGLAAVSNPAKDFSTTTTTLSWDEGAFVQASFAGIPTSQAEALLASLAWSDPTNHLAGFSGSGGSLVQLGQTGTGDRQVATQLELDYADQPTSTAPGQGRQLTVRTTTATGSPTATYLEAWFHGGRRADGSVASYDPTFGTLTLAWPDGRTAWLDADATPIDQAELQRVADGLTEMTSSQYRELETSAAIAQRADLPLLAAVTVTQGRVEVRGTSAAPVVCFSPSRAPSSSPSAVGSWTCSSSSYQPAPAVSVLEGDRWLVVAAGQGQVRVQAGAVGGGGAPLVPSVSTSAGAWTIVVATPSASTSQVTVMDDRAGEGLTRPPG